MFDVLVGLAVGGVEIKLSMLGIEYQLNLLERLALSLFIAILAVLRKHG